MRKNLPTVAAAVSFTILAAGCGPAPDDSTRPARVLELVWPELEGPTFRSGEHELTEIDNLPYLSDDVTPINEEAVDANGIHLYERDGIRYVHPVAQAQFGLAMLSNWRASGDEHYLDLATANADHLLQEFGNDDTPVWLSYEFDFELHGDPSNTIHGPWWSAMAQGQLLSLTSRLAQDTGDPRWREAAHAVFLSFVEIHEEGDLPADSPWVVFVEDDGWLWLEEYAGNVEPMRVLNGHVFAMYGLYDYWRLTGDERAEQIFDGAAETMLEFVPQLRNPGEPSWYGMRVQDNPVAQDEGYHRIHVRQLAMIGNMTDDERFTELSNQFRSDFY
ncbi:MAG: D-glucuronyl C5-epimerase family protein [Microbacterium sp.]